MGSCSPVPHIEERDHKLRWKRKRCCHVYVLFSVLTGTLADCGSSRNLYCLSVKLEKQKHSPSSKQELVTYIVSTEGRRLVLRARVSANHYLLTLILTLNSSEKNKFMKPERGLLGNGGREKQGLEKDKSDTENTYCMHICSCYKIWSVV